MRSSGDVRLVFTDTRDLEQMARAGDLTNGALLHKIERRVKRTRKMLERLEAIEAEDAIKIVKSVDWDVIEKWTYERLIEVGTERVKKETFAYKLAGVKETRKSA